MNKICRTIFTAILLASSASVLRAQDFKDYLVLRMPEIGTVMAKQLSACKLTATIVNEKGEPAVPKHSQLMRWGTDGFWKNDRNSNMVQILFPLRMLERLDLAKLRYRLDYEIIPAETRRPQLKRTEYLPLSGAEPNVATTLFPLETVTVDASGLNWAEKDAANGITAAAAKIIWKESGKAAGVAVPLKRDLPVGSALIGRGEDVSADIEFFCKDRTKVKWDENGKSLRKIAQDLNIKITQDVCR